jgi:hypothetical protein
VAAAHTGSQEWSACRSSLVATASDRVATNPGRVYAEAKGGSVVVIRVDDDVEVIARCIAVATPQPAGDRGRLAVIESGCDVERAAVVHDADLRTLARLAPVVGHHLDEVRHDHGVQPRVVVKTPVQVGRLLD